MVVPLVRQSTARSFGYTACYFLILEARFTALPFSAYSVDDKRPELERIWQAAVVAYFEVLAIICLEELGKARKTSARIADIPQETRSQYLPNASLERSRYTCLFDVAASFVVFGSVAA